MRRSPVGPIGIVGKLHADPKVAGFPRRPIDLHPHPASLRRPNVYEGSIGCAVRAGIEVRGALDEDFDRDAACRDPAMSGVDMDTVAVADRAVMDHETAVASPRASTEMVEVAALVLDHERHPSPPQSFDKGKFCHVR